MVKKEFSEKNRCRLKRLAYTKNNSISRETIEYIEYLEYEVERLKYFSSYAEDNPNIDECTQGSLLSGVKSL